MRFLASTLRALPLVALGLVAAGCGEIPEGVTGTIHGQPFTMRSAISTVGGAGISGEIILGTHADACEELRLGHIDEGERSIRLFVLVRDPTTGKTLAPTTPGTFTAAPNIETAPAGGNIVVGTYSRINDDITCDSTDTTLTVDGSLTLSVVDNGAYFGSGDFTFGTGESVSVAFEAMSCGALLGTFNSQSFCTK
jgi:hypothetical protein